MTPVHVDFVERRFPSRWKGRWFALLIAASPILLLCLPYLFGGAGLLAVLLGLAVATGVRLARRSEEARSGPAPVTYDRKFLALPHEFVALGDVRGAFAVPTEDGHGEVLIDLVDGSTVVLGLATPGATRLVEDLSLAPSQRVVRIPLVPPITFMRLWLFFLGTGTGLGFLLDASRNPVANLLVVGILAGPLLALLLPQLLRSGTKHFVAVARDGLCIEGDGTTRFLPYADVASVAVDKKKMLVVHRRQRKAMRLAMGVGGEAHVRALRIRLEEMTTLGPDERIASMLARGDRPLAEWRTSLAALAERGTDFRHPAHGAEDLARVLDHGGATPEVRVGAAVALRASDPEGAAKIRIAATETADDDLRAALEAIADDEPADAAMERALRVRE